MAGVKKNLDNLQEKAQMQDGMPTGEEIASWYRGVYYISKTDAYGISDQAGSERFICHDFSSARQAAFLRDCLWLYYASAEEKSQADLQLNFPGHPSLKPLTHPQVTALVNQLKNRQLSNGHLEATGEDLLKEPFPVFAARPQPEESEEPEGATASRELSAGRFENEEALGAPASESAVDNYSLPQPSSAPRAIRRLRPRLTFGDFRGVQLDPGGGYRASFHMGSKFIRCGVWKSVVQAAMAHDRVRLHLNFGLDKLNFPAAELQPMSLEEVRRLASAQRKSWISKEMREEAARLEAEHAQQLTGAASSRESLSASSFEDLVRAQQQGAGGLGLEETISIDLSQLEEEGEVARYRGVRQNPQSFLWEASIYVREEWESEKRLRRIGTYATPEKAAREYDRASRYYYPDSPYRLNFPSEGGEGASVATIRKDRKLGG